MNPRSMVQDPSDTTAREMMKHKPEPRSWIRQVPTPPGRCLHVPPMTFVYVPSGPTPRGAWVIDGRVSTVCYAWRDRDQRTRTRQTERLVLVMEQNRSFWGPGEMDKTSSGVIFGSVGTVDSCLAANTGKYICPPFVPEARRKRNPAAMPIKKTSHDRWGTGGRRDY